MKALAHRACALLMMPATGACVTVTADLPGAIRSDVTAAETEPVGTVVIEKGHWYFLWGLVGSPPADVFAADLKKQVRAKGADGVANVTYESQESCGDLIIGGLTCSLVVPRTLSLKGDLVRIKKPPLPGKPLALAEPATPAAMLARTDPGQRF